MGSRDAASLGGRLGRIRSVLDGVLSGAPETMLDLRRRLARELTIDPKPQVLQALAALREISDPKGRAIGSRAAILHLAVEASVFELWDAEDATPELLHRGVALIPPLIALASSVEQAFDGAIETVDHPLRDTIGKLHASLRLPEEPLLAAVVVVPEVTRLAAEARNGTLATAAPSLTSEERDAIAATIAQGLGAATRGDRVFVEAIALRTLMERDTARFLALPPAVAGDVAAAQARRELSRRLESERLAHGVVSSRLDAVRSEHFARTQRSDARLDRARRSLFAAYIALSKTLAGHPADLAGSIREQILEAEHAAEVVDAEKRATQGLMREATAGVGQATATRIELPPDMEDLLRERRRRKVLVAVAATLVPVALTANIAFYRGRGTSPATAPDFLSAAMPVQQIMPIGRALYSQVSTFLWEDLTNFERRNKVTELGRLAAQRGYQVLIVVDEARRERARWSVTRGAEVVPDRSSEGPQQPR